MIGKLSGVVDSFGPDWVVLDVHGVGYRRALLGAHAGSAAARAARRRCSSSRRRCARTRSGWSASCRSSEREWFRLLLTVQGVGAKVALSVLGTLKVADLASAIALQDKAMIARSPGVGPKVAARIVHRAEGQGADAFRHRHRHVVRLQAELGDKIAPRPAAEAVSALVNLGYGQAQASAAIAAAMLEAGDAAATAQLIRLGLKELAR